MVSAFMGTVRRQGAPSILYAELAAETEATFAIEEAVRTGPVVVVGATHAATAPSQ
jgi:hypothetical protein